MGTVELPEAAASRVGFDVTRYPNKVDGKTQGKKAAARITHCEAPLGRQVGALVMLLLSGGMETLVESSHRGGMGRDGVVKPVA